MNPAMIWFLGGLVMVLAEFAMPGIILIFLGLGAWVTSFALWMGWIESTSAQTMLFAISSVGLLVGLRRLFKSWLMGRSLAGTAEVDLEEFLGKRAKALTDIPANGTGKVEFKGVQWNALSDSPVSAGATVIITGREGLALRVRNE
jgi:inner membrane protein